MLVECVESLEGNFGFSRIFRTLDGGERFTIQGTVSVLRSISVGQMCDFKLDPVHGPIINESVENAKGGK